MGRASCGSCLIRLKAMRWKHQGYDDGYGEADGEGAGLMRKELIQHDSDADLAVSVLRVRALCSGPATAGQ